jgi:hypothetical protein
MHKEAYDLLLSQAAQAINKLARQNPNKNVQPAAGVGAFNRFASSAGNAVSGAYGAARQARQDAGQAVINRGRAIGSGIASGIADIPSRVYDAATSTGRYAPQQPAAPAPQAPAPQMATSPGADQLSATFGMQAARPAAQPSAPQSTAPQYFSVNRPQAPPQQQPSVDIDFERDLPASMHKAPPQQQGPGMRQAVTSFDQLPPEFQQRFRARLADGTVIGANEQDAVNSYNHNYANTARQLGNNYTPQSRAYGSLGRADLGQQQSAQVSQFRSPVA